MTKNGVTTVLWQNGSATTAGSSIIESCAFENGQVKLDLKDDYLLQSDEVFTVSFNVKINQYAKDQYTANQGYGGMTGGYNTDYGTNATSSFKPGFYSNTSAEVNTPSPSFRLSSPIPPPPLRTLPSSTIRSSIGSATAIPTPIPSLPAITRTACTSTGRANSPSPTT